jgi:hypothetical protein
MLDYNQKKNKKNKKTKNQKNQKNQKINKSRLFIRKLIFFVSDID